MKRYNFIDHRRLGFFTKEFIEALGDECAYRIMRAVGGLHVNVPKHLNDKCYLAQHLNAADLAVLIQHYGNSKILIPKYDKIAKQVRNARIHAARKDGWSVKEIALKHGLSERSVFLILSGDDAAEDDQQFDPYEGGQLF